MLVGPLFLGRHETRRRTANELIFISGVKLRSSNKEPEIPTSTKQRISAEIQIQTNPRPTQNKQNAARMKEYRKKLQQNPDVYQAAQQCHATYMRLQRASWTEEQKQKNKIQSKERMKKYRTKKKAIESKDKKEFRTRQDHEKIKAQREQWKLAKQKEREKMTSQKRRRIREKDRERKRKKNEKKASPKSTVSLEQDLASVESTSSSCNPIAYTTSALYKAVSRVKTKLPKSPAKYAEVVSKLIEKASPKKTYALKLKGIDSGKEKEWNEDLSSTIKETYKSMKGRRKCQVQMRREFVRQLAIKVKHRNKEKICSRLGINRKFFNSSCKERKEKKRKDAVDVETVRSVEDFFNQEDISINVPNKKAVNKDGINKLVLQTSYEDCFRKWKEREPAKKLSFSKFVKLKPKNVLTQKKRHLLGCLCEYCEGVRLKLNAVNMYATQLNKPEMKPGDKNTCVALILCPKNGEEYNLRCIDRACTQCSSKDLENKIQPLLELEEITWQSWDLVQYENHKTGKKSSKRELVEKSDSPEAFINLFIKEVTFLAVHLFEARWQQVQFSKLSKSVKKNQVMLTADFAENFTCFSQNEIQGAHWMRNAVTIHPTIANYKCPVDGEIVEEAIDIITDDLVHDAHAFHKFNTIINQHLTEVQQIPIEELIIITDGCASQYKCKSSFFDASNGLEDIGVVIERSYYGSRHGKNRCDGEGGILKNKVTRAIKNGEVVVNSAEKFAAYCKKTLTKGKLNGNQCNHKRRTIIYIKKEDIDHNRQFIDVKVLKGTRKLHSVRGVEKGVILTRRLSCYCTACLNHTYDQCQNTAYVDNWERRSLLPVARNQQQKRRKKRTDDDEQPVADEQAEQQRVEEPAELVEQADQHQQPIEEPVHAVESALPDVDIDDTFEAMTAMNMSFEDISFNNSLDISGIDKLLADDETGLDQQEQKYNIGEYVLVNQGVDLLPAVVTGTEGSSLLWVNFYKNKRDQWTEDATPYTVTTSDIVRKLQPPDLVFIWNRHNQLIREMGFGEPMHGLCFANTRGDIFIGFQNHICSIPLTSYFPRNYLERITRTQFKDEYREPPIGFNHRIKASFDPKAIPQYSISFSKRTEEKKPCEGEDILEDLEATPREPRSRVQEDSPLDEDEHVEEEFIELPAVTLESPSPSQGHLVERGYSAPGPIPSKKLKLEKMKRERRKSDTQYLEKLSPYERDLMKRKLIIAPDCYIPNSVVRKRLGFVPPSTPVKKTDTWTIESIKLPVEEKPVKTIQTHEEEEEKWEKVKARYLQFLEESSDEGELEPEISRPPRYGGRPFNGRGRGEKKVRVIDSDDDDDLELDDSEVVEDSDIFTNDNDYDIIQPEPRIQPEIRKKEEVKARYLQFLDESSEDNTELSTSSSESESEDSDSEPERTISMPPRHIGGGRPQNAGRGRGKKKVRVIDSDDEDLEFDDSEPVEDTDIFPQGYDIEIGQSLVGGPMSLLRAGSDLKEIRPFSWGDDKELDEGGRKSSKSSYSPWKKMQQPMMRTSSNLSNLSTSSSKLGFTGTRKSTPTTPKYELKSKQFDFHRVDLDMGTPERMRRSVGTRSRERTKSFRLTNMVVDEQSTNVTFKEDSKLAHRKGLLPAAVDMDVIRRLLEEDFFPDLNGTASFDLIMQNLIRLLDTEDSELHAKICDYIMCIHRDIGIPDHYLDRIIGKLSLQLGGDNSSLKRFCLRTLKEIGADRQDVLATILPRLMDAQDDIREEAKNVLGALSDVENKEELLELMNSMGLTQKFDSKDEEEEALKALAMRLDIPFRSDSFTDWINNWVDDSSSIYDSEPEVKFDDIEKAWDGRQRKWKHDSLCLTESASRASTRMRELSFLSKGSRTPIPEVEENSLDTPTEEDLERKKTEGQLSGRYSGKSHRGHDGNEVLGLTRQGFLTREEPLLQQREGSSYSAEEEDWFDPRESGLYRYYKNRYNREKEAEGKFNYKSISKVFSRTQLGGADETDSQVGSLDSCSQIGDTLSTNDSGIISIQDSGIGRDVSESHGHSPYKASLRLMKEKIQTKPLSYRSRIGSHHNLSPVKSSSTGSIGGMSIKSSPREKDPEWIKFFQTPTALERKRMEMVKKDYTEGKIKPGSAAVINYINDSLPMLPGEAGLRLLKSVKVGGDKDMPPLSDRQHRIESIPGKLGVHTKSEDKGQSKYGILQMQWTTDVPVPVSHDTYPERYSSMSDATSTLGGSSTGTHSIKRPLPSIVHKYANTERSSTTQFIDDIDYRRLPGSVYSPDYEWDYPIPPPPATESRISVPYIRKEHDRYCKYYTVVKKKMQNLSSKRKASTLDQQLLPKVEIKKALPERLKLPRELTRLSRVSSVLYPPLTLHQLMSART